MKAAVAAVLASVRGEVMVLDEVRAEASIHDLLAEVTVTQRYRNPKASPIEAVYTFPLPVDAVLLGFEVEIGDRRLVGAVVEKAEAERRYEDAITDGDSAVLLEQAESGLFVASVGNLLPGETASIRFRYGLLLRWNGDRVRFAMPTTIAPRYGDPVAAGLAPHQAPVYAFDAERAFHLRVAVRGLLKDARFDSPSHGISVASQADATMIALTGTPAMDRDVVLEARATRPEANGALVVRDVDLWVALASFRPEIPMAGDDQRRSATIVVDCSGSMGGDSIAQARAALERILDDLRAGDLFEIIAFGSSQRALFGRETPVSATAVAQARRFVRALDANMGGTEIAAALEAAYAVRGASDLHRDLLLITDGEVWDDGSVVGRAGRSGHRFFTVGVGAAAAEPFLRGLAEATGGACEIVSPREDMAERIHRHFQRIYAPRARSAFARWPAQASCRVPEAIGPVYGGDTVHLFAWFAEMPAGPVGLEVTLADGRVVRHETAIQRCLPNPAAMPAADAASLPALARLAAARRLAATEDGKAATALAVRYQLISKWTNAIVVHARADDEKAEGLPTIIRVPHVPAAGWHGLGTELSGSIHVRALRSAFSAPAPDNRRVDARRLPSHPFAWPMRGVAAAAIGPTALVARLNAHAVSSSPTLDDLEAWGAPDAVLTILRDLVGQGVDEAIVVAAFLYLLAGSPAGNALDRQVRRTILKAYKTVTPHQAVMDATTRAFDAWQGRPATTPTGW